MEKEQKVENLALEKEPKTEEGELGKREQLDSIQEAVGTCITNLETLGKEFQSKIRVDSSKEKIIDRLHTELQEYKDQLGYTILRPMVMELIRLYDDMGKMIKNIQGKPEEERNNELENLLLSYQDSLEGILYNNGIESFAHEGDLIEPKKQQSIKGIPTDDPDQNKKIAERIKKGFSYENFILRKEVVNTYIYQNNQEKRRENV